MQSSHDNGVNKESVIVLSCSLHHRLRSQMTPSCAVDCCIVWQPTKEGSVIVSLLSAPSLIAFSNDSPVLCG